MEARARYDAWHTHVAGGEALDTPWHRLVQAALDAGRDLQGQRVLEIACGRGELASWCVRRAAPSLLVAADFSWSAVQLADERARAHAGARAAVIQADAQAIPLPSGSIDTAICCETIEHVPSPRLALAELARVLRPGGRLFLTHPSYLGPMGLYRGYLRVRGRRFTEEGQPINHMLVAPLVRHWLRRAGLRIEASAGAGHYVPFPGRSPVLVADRPRWLHVFGLHALTVAVKERA